MDIFIAVLWILLAILVEIVAVVLVCFILWILIATILGWCVNTKKDHIKRNKFYAWYFETSLSVILNLLRVKVHYEGDELVPKDEKFLLVSNHVSNYDSLAVHKAMRKYGFGVISKPSNLKIPFFGRMTRKCNFYPIDRENARNAVKTINVAAEAIKAGEASMIVYPEGTRNKSAQGLLPFHNSVFKVAQKAKCPIVVISTRGTEKVHKCAPFRKSHIYLKVLEVIPTEEVMATRTSEIGAKVEGLLLADEKEWREKESAGNV
ncbi:MAG: 1-acyl-sn-glycerol-3-phosphate acyltransferase [Clostridia bacterium]|nr:1-acyl-sn-glycerol-3-phosphate acyltransferase [Clostridia bacterium]